MTVGNDKELKQDTCSGKTKANTFKKIQDSFVLPEEDAVAGEPTSQVVEERADTVPLRSFSETAAKKSTRKQRRMCYLKRQQ
jgi:hypothetical protein